MRAEYTVTTSEVRRSAIESTSRQIAIINAEISMRIEQRERLERVLAGIQATEEQSQ